MGGLENFKNVANLYGRGASRLVRGPKGGSFGTADSGSGLIRLIALNTAPKADLRAAATASRNVTYCTHVVCGGAAS